MGRKYRSAVRGSSFCRGARWHRQPGTLLHVEARRGIAWLFQVDSVPKNQARLTALEKSSHLSPQQWAGPGVIPWVQGEVRHPPNHRHPLQTLGRWGSIPLRQQLEQPTARSSGVFVWGPSPSCPSGGSGLDGDTLARGRRRFFCYAGGPTQVVLLNGIKQRAIMLPWGSSGEPGTV